MQTYLRIPTCLRKYVIAIYLSCRRRRRVVPNVYCTFTHHSRAQLRLHKRTLLSDVAVPASATAFLLLALSLHLFTNYKNNSMQMHAHTHTYMYVCICMLIYTNVHTCICNCKIFLIYAIGGAIVHYSHVLASIDVYRYLAFIR